MNTTAGHHRKCFDYAMSLAEGNGAEPGTQSREWAAIYLANSIADCLCDEYNEMDAQPAVDVTPGCEGGPWCRCPKSTPCYPPAAGAVDDVQVDEELAAGEAAAMPAAAEADLDDVLAEIRAAQPSTSTITAEAVRRADEFRRELAGAEGEPAIEARLVREARFEPASTVTYLAPAWPGGRRFHRDLVDLVEEARRTDAGVDLDDDEPLDREEALRLLDDPATWKRVRAALRSRGFDVDGELVEQVRRAAGRGPR